MQIRQRSRGGNQMSALEGRALQRWLRLQCGAGASSSGIRRRRWCCGVRRSLNPPGITSSTLPRKLSRDLVVVLVGAWACCADSYCGRVGFEKAVAGIVGQARQHRPLLRMLCWLWQSLGRTLMSTRTPSELPGLPHGQYYPYQHRRDAPGSPRHRHQGGALA